MEKQKIRLICLGANNPHVIKIAHAIERNNPQFQLIGFVDSDKKKWEKPFFNYPVFGGLGKVKEFSKDYVFCNMITQTTLIRKRTTQQIIKNGGELINFIHPSVDLEMVKIGIGNYIQEQVVIQSEVKIGDNSSIHLGSLIAHNCIIEDSVFIAFGCNLSGKVVVEEGSFIGAGATILPKVRIGKWSIIGAGAVVTKDVEPYSVMVGVPARLLRKVTKQI